jgi:hypothetical protein
MTVALVSFAVCGVLVVLACIPRRPMNYGNRSLTYLDGR